MNRVPPSSAAGNGLRLVSRRPYKQMAETGGAVAGAAGYYSIVTVFYDT
jgi:hypothetical protein